MLYNGGVTAHSRYQTNAILVHDFMKTMWPQDGIFPWWGTSHQTVYMYCTPATTVAGVRSLCKLNMNLHSYG